jgi:hypothetical protein
MTAYLTIPAGGNDVFWRIWGNITGVHDSTNHVGSGGLIPYDSTHYRLAARALSTGSDNTFGSGFLPYNLTSFGFTLEVMFPVSGWQP